MDGNEGDSDLKLLPADFMELMILIHWHQSGEIKRTGWTRKWTHQIKDLHFKSFLSEQLPVAAPTCPLSWVRQSG